MAMDELLEIPVGCALNPGEGEAPIPIHEAPQGEEREAVEKAAQRVTDASGRDESFQVMDGVRSDKLSEAGWGVVFPAGKKEEVEKNLSVLLEWRKAQAGERYQELEYTPGMPKEKLLVKADGRGPVDPDKVPYYLLIVGSPAEIPFDFQYQLDVQYAVGRICFEDPEDYKRYAKNVVDTEKNGLMRPKRAGFFGAATPGDKTTEGSVVNFIEPLCKFTKEKKKWEVESRVREAATRAQLKEMLLNPPTLMVTATHGGLPDRGSALVKSHTGALLCQDFQGRLGTGSAPPANCYFAARDVPPEADLRGSIFLIFACFGAGIPQLEDFLSFTGRKQLADQPFVSALPLELLRRGALAVIGHVERAFYYSFEGLNNSQQLQSLQSLWSLLLSEAPVGFAMEPLNERYAEFAAELTGQLLRPTDKGIRRADQMDLSKTWNLMNDARNYCIIGDPAVRICVTEKTRKLLMPSAESEGIHATMARPAEELDLDELAERLAALLAKSVEVTTLTGEGGPVAARTRVGLDGQVVNEIATEDEGLRQMHAQAVEKAMAERAELARLVKEVMERAQ